MVPFLCAVPFASSPNGSGVGRHFSLQSCTTKFRNCVRYRQTTSSYRKSNTTIYKNWFTTMFLKPLLLLLLGIMAGNLTLKKPFTLGSIAFRWTKHPLPEYDYFDTMMNL